MRLASPPFLHLQRVPLRSLVITAALAYVLQIAAIVQHYPLWAIVLVTLVPWIPLFVLEAAWKYQHYGHLAIFAASVVFQLGFLVESSAQLVGIYTGGAAAYHPTAEELTLARTIGLWMGCNILVLKFSRNRWVWAAWAIAGVHLVDQLYISAAYFFDPAFYRGPGSAGLFARGGVLGLMLARPFVDFLFAYFQLIPLAIGLLFQAAHAYDQFLAQAIPSLGEGELVATTGRLQRLAVAAGTVIIRQGDLADRFYVLAHGEVEVIQQAGGDERRVALLHPGQFFGEIGLMTPDARRTATVRAVTPAELLTLDRDGFRALFSGSAEPGRDLKTEVARRLAELQT